MKAGFLDHPHGFGGSRTQRRDGRLGSAPRGVPVESSNVWGTLESRPNRRRSGPPTGWGRPRTVLSNNNNNNNNNSSPMPFPTSISSESSLTGTTLALSTLATTTTSNNSTTTTTTTASPLRYDATSHRHDDDDNPFAGQPWLPVKTMGVPKAALNDWYMQKPRSWQCSNDQYITWNDGGMPHQMKFTCAFVCPLSGEVFLSGEYGTHKQYQVQEDALYGTKIVWYTKKTGAQHGVASRVYDCMSYRNSYGTDLRSVHLGHERPYLSPSHITSPDEARRVPRMPVNIPPTVMEQIEQLVEKSRRQRQVTEIVLQANQQYMDEEDTMEYEAIMEQNAYRQSRQSDLT